MQDDMTTAQAPIQASVFKRQYWRLHDQAKGLGKRWRNIAAMLRFIADASIPLTLGHRIGLMRRFVQISRRVRCYHKQAEMVAVARSIFALPSTVQACIIEAGCAHGGSAAKLSLCAALAGRTLYLFDSFAGIPENTEKQVRVGRGWQVVFQPGQYTGPLDEVRANITRYGVIEVCRFKQGWFSDTMPGFKEPIGVAYVDVDLVSSTRDCLRHLYPLLVPGGAIYSQDAHLSGVLALLQDTAFWRNDVGVAPPVMERLASPALMRIDSPAAVEPKVRLPLEVAAYTAGERPDNEEVGHDREKQE